MYSFPPFCSLRWSFPDQNDLFLLGHNTKAALRVLMWSKAYVSSKIVILNSDINIFALTLIKEIRIIFFFLQKASNINK